MCVIKESFETETILHTLTEANGGVTVLDDPQGKVGLFIASADTVAITADFAVYTIVKLDTNFPTLDNERILEGRIIYKKGTY